MTEHFRIRGNKAGGGKGGDGGHEADDTLHSKARAKMIEMLSEGEIVGLVNGAKSIFFDQTPVQNIDGTYNFKNVIFDEHKGLPNEGYFNGADAVETPVDVNVQVKKNTGAVTRTIVDTNADAVRVIMNIPSLAHQDKKSGDLTGTDLSYKIEVRGNAGVWQTAVTQVFTNEKTTSPFQIAHRVNLPLNGSPWDIRVTRLTDDSDLVELQNDLYWEGYVILVEGKFIYPHTAAVSLEVNAEDMGQSIPARSFHIRGLKINVPSNYNPDTRAYTGLWDGTFKIAYSNNPAWVFYDLLVNDRYGLGQFVSPAIVDKWSLYTIAQYCDQLVPSGYKNTSTGANIMEPRFTFNGVIANRDDAYFVLQQISTAWRGMAYWSLGRVFASADMPSDVVKKIVAPANAIDGEFSYSGTAVKARHSVCVVSWNDPADFYRPAKEVVIDEAAVLKYGWREKPLTLQGCVSRGLAHRYGKWVLDVEQHETETVEYTASLDHLDIVPGNIIAIADPNKAGVRLGGRIKSHVGNVITLDSAFEPAVGESYALLLAMPDGSVDTKAVSSFSGASVTVAAPFSATAAPDAMFAIKGTDVQPRQYRVLSIVEDEKNKFKVTALFHDPTKYARVEQDINFDPIPYSRPRNTAVAPTDLRAKETTYVSNGVVHSRLTFSWTPSQDILSKNYNVVIDTPDRGKLPFNGLTQPSIDLNDIVAGNYSLSVSSVTITGMISTPAVLTYTALGPTGIPMPTVSNIHLINGSSATEFSGRDVRIAWDNNFATSSDSSAEDYTPVNGVSPLYKKNTVKVYDSVSNTLLRTQDVTSALFTYSFEMNAADCAAASLATPSRKLRFSITVTDRFDRQSVADDATFSNPVPGAIAPTPFVAATTIFLDWTDPVDNDYIGTLIWLEKSSGYDPLTTTPKYDGARAPVSIPVDPETDYFLRIAGYDAFGKTGLNISTEMHLTTMPAFDVEPPATPTGLALTSSIDENGQCNLFVTWDANTEDDLKGYEIQIKQGTGNFVSIPTDLNSWNREITSGVSYTVKVAALDNLNNKSNYSDPETIVGALDTVPPAAPTWAAVNPILAGIDAIWLKWVNPADKDLKHIRILENDVDDIATATEIATPSGTSFAITGLPLLETRYYWLKAVDYSDNESDPTDVVSATTGSLPDGVKITTDGVLFKPNDGATNKLTWTAGTISYGPDGVAPTSKTIDAGFVNWASGKVYVYYVQGNTALSTTTNLTTLYASNGVLMGVYKGGTDFQLVEGRAYQDGGLILSNTIGANQLVTDSAVITGSAQIKDAIITSAKIVELDAAKLTAGSAIAGTITVNGSQLGVVKNNAELGAQNPATRINAGTTKIDPGLITVSGSTTLSDWRMAGDLTKINGGAISANTIAANSAVFGLRGLTIDGLNFEANDPATNQLSWTAGTIIYTDNTGATVAKAISAGSATWATGTVFIYYVQGATTLSSTTSASTANAANAVVIATYKGGTALVVNYGRTIIDGDHIKTGTITATQIDVTSIRASILQANVITSPMIQAGAITASKILVGGAANVVSFDPQFLDTAAWSYAGGGTANYAGSYNSGRAIITSSAKQIYFDNNKFAINPRKDYEIDIVVYQASSAAHFYGVWHFFDYAGNIIPTGTGFGWPSFSSNNFYFPVNTPGTGDYVQYKLAFGPSATAKIPSNACFMAFGMLPNYPSGAVYTVVARAWVSEKLPGSLIVDGSIFGSKIATNGIETANIALDQVTKVLYGTLSSSATLGAAVGSNLNGLNTAISYTAGAVSGGVSVNITCSGTAAVNISVIASNNGFSSYYAVGNLATNLSASNLGTVPFVHKPTTTGTWEYRLFVQRSSGTGTVTLNASGTSLVVCYHQR